MSNIKCQIWKARHIGLAIILGLLACNLGAALGTPVPSPTLPGIPTQPPVGVTSTAAASPTPALPPLTRLTEPGCCVQPGWSADGQQVVFIDKPDPAQPTGIYGVSIDGGPPQLLTERIGLPSPDGRFKAYLNDAHQTVVEEIATGGQVVIPNDGLQIIFSPTSLRLAWEQTIAVGNFDQMRTVISISDIDGNNAHEVHTLFGGGIAGWLDDDHLLLVGKNASADTELVLFSLSVVDGTRVDVVRQQRMRSIAIAPGGKWITYAITLDPDGPDSDGLWMISADGSQHYRLDVFGGARWRDGTHLLIVPMEPRAPSHRLLQLDAPSGQIIALTEPSALPFRIAAGDWSVSPTGEAVVFMSADDQALWLLHLPTIE
jgi:hypothetical protein